MFKVNNKSRTTTITTSFCVFIVNYEISRFFSTVSIVDFEQVNVNWVTNISTQQMQVLIFLAYRKIRTHNVC